MDDQTTQSVTDAEIIDVDVTDVSSNDIPETENQATVLLSLEELIKRHISSIEKLQVESKKHIIAILSLSALLVSSHSSVFAQTATSTAYPRTKQNVKINPQKFNTHKIVHQDPSKSLNKAIDQLSQIATKLETRISSASAA